MPIKISINLRVTSFGHVILEMGNPTPPFEVQQTVPVREKVRYREPLETASLIYKVRFGEQLTDYVVPLTTA